MDPAFNPGTLRDPTKQHFELEFGANVQAVLKYRIFDSDNYVEIWIKNAVHFGDARCRFIKGTHVEEWALEALTWGADPFGTGLICWAYQGAYLGDHSVDLETAVDRSHGQGFSDRMARRSGRAS